MLCSLWRSHLSWKLRPLPASVPILELLRRHLLSRQRPESHRPILFRQRKDQEPQQQRAQKQEIRSTNTSFSSGTVRLNEYSQHCVEDLSGNTQTQTSRL